MPLSVMSGMKKWRVDLLVVLIYLGAVLLFGHHTIDYRVDDAFITYRYSWNLGRHGEFVYNRGQRILATSSPLNAVILAPFASIVSHRQILPLIAKVLSIASALCTALFVYFFIRRRRGFAEGLVLSSPFVLLSHVYVYAGLETNLFVGLLIVAVASLVSRRYYLAGLIVGLAYWARADSALMLVLFGMYVSLFEEAKSLENLKSLGIGAASILLPSFLACYLYFGTVLPSTLGTKMFQGRTRMFSPPILESILISWGPEILSDFHAFNLSLGIFAGLFIYQQLKRLHHRKKIDGINLFILFLVAFGFLQAWAYTLFGVGSNYRWYQVPLMLSYVFGLFGFVLMLRSSMKRGGQCISITLLLLVVFINMSSRLIAPPWSGSLGDTYIRIANYLNASTDPVDLVGLGETGIIGYYLEREVFDYFGVVTPWWVGELSGQYPGQWSGPMQAALQRAKPAYVVGQYPFPVELDSSEYLVVEVFDPNYAGWKLAIYKRGHNSEGN